jgi:hypothetical protein
MTRRTALATAGGLTIVLLAAAAAVATNLGLLQVSTDTGQVGRLSSADLAPAREVQQPTPPGAQAPGDDGGGAQEPAGGGEPGETPTTSTLGHDDGRAGHDDGRTHERFEGRGDDD